MWRCRSSGTDKTFSISTVLFHVIVVQTLKPRLRQMFDGEHAEQMKRSLEERRSKVDIVAVKKEYDEWWSKYNAFKVFALLYFILNVFQNGS